MSKPKWRKVPGGWKRGVLEVYRDAFTGYWVASVDGDWIDDCPTPEAAIKAAKKEAK